MCGVSCVFLLMNWQLFPHQLCAVWESWTSLVRLTANRFQSMDTQDCSTYVRPGAATDADCTDAKHCPVSVPAAPNNVRLVNSSLCYFILWSHIRIKNEEVKLEDECKQIRIRLFHNVKKACKPCLRRDMPDQWRLFHKHLLLTSLGTIVCFADVRLAVIRSKNVLKLL